MSILRRVAAKVFRQKSSKRTASCSFCGKSSRKTGPLVEGPDEVYICHACLELGLQLLDRERERRRNNPAGESSNISDRDRTDETRKQIRGMVDEIQQLAASKIETDAFYHEFLARVVASLAAIGGAVWLVSDDGQLKPRALLGTDEVGIALEEFKRRRDKLSKILSLGENCTIQPCQDLDSGRRVDCDPELNPTRCLLLIGLLHAGVYPVGLVEVFQRPGTAPQVQRGYARFIREVCGHADKFHPDKA